MVTNGIYCYDLATKTGSVLLNYSTLNSSSWSALDAQAGKYYMHRTSPMRLVTYDIASNSITEDTVDIGYNFEYSPADNALYAVTTSGMNVYNLTTKTRTCPYNGRHK